jgi:hypothetical protein
MAYPRKKNACPGCRAPDEGKAISCLACRIKNCEKLAAGEYQYCYECPSFPCDRVKHLDKRYRTKYANTPIGNLRMIQEIGIDEFVARENEKWACPQCGIILCMHRPKCLSCGYEWHT